MLLYHAQHSGTLSAALQIRKKKKMFIMVIITVFISSFVDLQKQGGVKIGYKRKTNLQA